MTKTKQCFSFLIPLLLLLISLMHQKECMLGVETGLRIALEKAFPALFPALVISRILTATVPRSIKRGAYFLPFFMGLFCGFPVGAATIIDLRKKGLLSRKDGEKLLFFCCNAGPSFVLGVCGIGVFHSSKAGALLLTLQCALSFIFFLCFLSKKSYFQEETKETENSFPPFYKVLSSALKDALSSFLYILSCIVFFSFITELIFSLLSVNSGGEAVFHLFCELTGGVAKLETFPLSFAFPICGAALGWSSLSVHLQTLGLLSESDLSYKSYLLGRMFFSLLMAVGASFLQKLL